MKDTGSMHVPTQPAMPTQPLMPATTATAEKAPGIVSETARRFFANRLSVLGLVVVVPILWAAVFADLLAPYPRDHVFFADMLEDPSLEHSSWGTDVPATTRSPACCTVPGPRCSSD